MPAMPSRGARDRFASGSTHISRPKAASWQAPRIAHARGVAPETGARRDRGERRGKGSPVLGEPRVNVLLVNLALDGLFGRPPIAGR